LALELSNAHRRVREAETKISAFTSQVVMLSAALETRDASLEAAQTRANDCEQQLLETRMKLASVSTKKFATCMTNLEKTSLQCSRYYTTLESELERLRNVESDLVAAKEEVATVKAVAAEKYARQAAALVEAREYNAMLTKEVGRLSALVFRACKGVSSVAATFAVASHRSRVEECEASQNTTSNRVLENQLAMDSAQELLSSLQRELDNWRTSVAFNSLTRAGNLSSLKTSVTDKTLEKYGIGNEMNEAVQESHCSTAVVQAELVDARERLIETQTKLKAAEVERSMLHRMLSVKTHVRMAAGGM
jgi:hypothetical protein